MNRILMLLMVVVLTAGGLYAQQPVLATQAGNWTTRIVGNVGGVLDAVQGATAPANVLVVGGTFNTSLPTIGNGDSSQFQIDAKGQMFADVNYWAGTSLGAPSAYGTSPGAVNVPGVNAFITNTVPISGTFSIAPSTSSAQAFLDYHASSAAAANIKASAGNLYGLALGNNGTAACWLQLFNTAGTPTAGTSVVDSYMVQAGVAIVVPAGAIALKNFTTGIAAAGATTDSGATTTGCTTTFSVTAYYF